MKPFILICSLLFSYSSQAQLRHALDTIRYDIKQDRSFFFCLDGKNSFIKDIPLKFFGMQAGYTFNNRTNLFIGYYSTYNDRAIVLENPTALKGDTDSNTLFKLYGLSYLNVGCEYYFHNSRKWRFALPVSVGIGSALDKEYNEKRIFKEQYKFTMPVDIGLYASYKLKWWIWLGAGIGTRVTVFQSDYSAPFYTYGFNIRIGEIYKRAKIAYRKANE